MTQPRDYKDEFDRLVLLLQCAAEMSIDLEFIENTIGRAESIGPIIDPTAFLKGARNLEDQRDVMRVAAPFIRGARELVAKHNARRKSA